MLQGIYQARQRKSKERRRRRKTKAATRASRRQLRHEQLEERCVLALLGVAPLGLPIVSYDVSGSVDYNAVSDSFQLHAIPIQIETSSAIGPFFDGAVSLSFQVDGSGALSGHAPGDDFVLTGDVDVDGDFIVDYSGTLLTGEIAAFGFQDSGGSTDAYDFRVSITGGQLASMYAGKDLGISTSSENSNFIGNFGVNFHGNAKGELGAIDKLTPGIDIEKLTNGVDADDPADAPEVVAGDPVTFTYVVTNTGSVAFASADVNVTDDNGTPSDSSDDLSTGSGDLILDPLSDTGNDGILSPGEVWEYHYTTTALDLDPSVENCGCDVGTYENFATVTVPGATDTDVSHYTNPSDAPPCISYDSNGQVIYNSTTDEFTLTATPIQTEDGGPFFSGSVAIHLIVDSTGGISGNVPGDDFSLQGDLDADGDFIVDYSGTLLTGEIISFVATDSGGSTDTYEFRFHVTGGLLAAQYVGKDIIVSTSSENSTFTGNFNVDFHGNAKGEICCTCADEASLSGHKYTDITGDGYSIDDTPLANVTINLYQDFGVIGVRDGADVLYTSTMTDPSGLYSFTELPAGDYLVEEIVPAGYVPTSATVLAVTLAGGDNVTTGFDFTNFAVGSISGKKFTDVNGDGMFNGSDSGLAGVTIELDKDANGTVDDTTVTGAGGAYSFNNLTAGTYRVREVGQVGWIQTTVNPGDVSVVSGTNSTGNDFGNFQLGAISGKKFTDVNGDGIFNGSDSGLAGVTIELDKDANGTVDATTVTFAGGAYSFTGLVAGTYRIREVGQVGWIQTTVNPGDVSVVSGTNSQNNDFGNFQLGAISGKKFVDNNGDGVLNGSDAGLAGWTIELDKDANGTVDATMVTGAGGAYSFSGLVAGTYRIREAGQVGWIQTTVNPGDVSVVSGTNSQNNNFGNFQLGAISGKKFQDNNGDGILNGSDAGLAGWTIELDKDANGTVDATTVTIAGGAYSFSGLTAGTYRVREVGQVGWIQITVNPGDVAVVSGTNSQNNNFGNFQLGAISGKKFVDNNGDGILNGSDAGLAGVTIQLDKDANGTVDATTVTVAGGAYSFSGLVAGTYRIREVGQVGWIQTTVNPGDVSVVSGTNSQNNNFGNFQLGAISGKKFVDNNGDGILNGSDAGLAGVTIQLDKDANGTVDATTVTVAGGAYSFTGLVAGTYRIREVGQVGWIQTTVNPGDVSVVSGTNSQNNNFGNFQLGAISGKKFVDNNGDGILNGSDAGLAGVTIQLDKDANGTVDATTVTVAGGAYSFSGLVAGTYRIREVGQVGWIQTTVNPGDVSVVSGTNSQNNNFGNFQLGAISGKKFVDNNGDGILNGSDAGLAGVTIQLDKDANGTVDATTVTVAGGAYSFSGLVAGTYRIREVGQVGWIQTTVNPGDVSVVSGTNSQNNNFGNFQLGAISGKKFVDNNGDGVLNGSDAGLAGVTIQLDKDANGTVDATTVTVAGGAYSFSGLVAGTYRIREVGQVGWIQTTVNPGDVSVVSGTNSQNNNFGNFQLGSISGKKFGDANSDGIMNGADAGLAGWTIQLDKNADGIVDATTVTVAGGAYSFTGLTAGTYRIREVGQSGWTQTTVNPGDVTMVSGLNSQNVNFGNHQQAPGIDIEKTTNGTTNSNPVAPDYDNEDAMNGPGVPMLTPGSTVTWTYKVKNTGETTYTTSDIVIVDDNGSPSLSTDDMKTTNGQITFQSVQTGDTDNLLEPGEVWLYKATGIVQNVGSTGATVTFDFSGNTALDGTDGNIRTFTSGGVSVKASAFSRSTAGAWSTAWLGSYGGGLGVTDGPDGTGANNQHTVDNSGSDNYVLFEFSESIVLDSAFLGYVVGDSDLKVWIGTKTDPFNNHLTLSDSVLTSLGFTELNETTSTTTRLADLNAGFVAGNVIVIAAKTGETTKDDMFKIQKMTVNENNCYENKAVITVPGATDSDLSHYCTPAIPPNPGIDIEKFTNGVDADKAEDAPEIAPGDTVTWTYYVKNTGNVAFTASQVVVTDDNGTTTTSDDFAPTRVTSTDVGGDGILSPGETWTYTASSTAQELLTAGASGTFDFSGSSALSGTTGNIRTFSTNGVSVKTSAFSRDSSGNWASAYLGSYGGGLGVTDGSENGSNDTHTVDNLGRDNYVLFEFSENVVVDSAFLGYVVGDSDLKVWIGTKTDPFNNHLTLSDSVLTSLGFTELNETTATGTRLADINAGGISGNVIVISANTGEPTQDDRFKIEKMTFEQLESGIYRNVGKVTAGGVSDTDVSHYKNPDCLDIEYAFAGNTAVTGTKGNVLTYTQNNVSVNVSASSRTTAGAWSTAYLGVYADGLGVTDTSENGANGTHRVDNIGQMNFVLFEFSTQVTIDKAYLASVVGDSDVSIFIGTADNPFHNHLTLSDSLSSIMSYADTNLGGGTDRWADFNPDGVTGNVLVIAANVTESSPNDQFKISKLDVCAKTTKFYVVDAAADDTFEYGTTGQALAHYNINSANTNARGVATTAAGDKVWVIDANKKVYVYDVDGKLLGSWTASGITTPEDITTDGTNIWIVDDGSNKVFKFANAASVTNGSTLTAASSFALNSSNANATGIVTNGSYIWVVNNIAGSGDKVFKYNMTGTMQGSWTIDSRNADPTGITIDPSNANHIWIVDNVDDAVYRYQAAASRTSASQNAASLFQLAAGNTDAQGIADPPPGGLEISLPAAIESSRTPDLAAALSISVKDNAIANWSPTSKAASARPASRVVATRSNFATTTNASQLKNSLLALDSAFADHDSVVADGVGTRGSKADDRWSADDEADESIEDEALVAALAF